MKILFLLDENIPYDLIGLLEKRGFKVNHLKKIGKVGIKNGEVYELAEEMNAWIVTRDADFQNMGRYISHQIAGIILFKLSKTRTNVILSAMQDLLRKYGDKLSEKHLTIMEDKQIRVYCFSVAILR